MTKNAAWTAILVLLTVGLMAWTSFLVGRARGRYGVKAPATTGQPDFERVFRVQMNTLEACVMFLPALWVASLYGLPLVTWVAGLVFVAGRVLYALAYMKEAGKRSAGFTIASVGFLVVLGNALVGLLRSLAAS
jgi:uncharacterized membrane protein YecN with MAPEG domain